MRRRRCISGVSIKSSTIVSSSDSNETRPWTGSRRIMGESRGDDAGGDGSLVAEDADAERAFGARNDGVRRAAHRPRAGDPLGVPRRLEGAPLAVGGVDRPGERLARLDELD